MHSNRTPKDRLPWTRYWSPRKTRDYGPCGEFYDHPKILFGESLPSRSRPLAEITPKTGLLVLCGEPGLGKTTELELLRERMVAHSDGVQPLIYLKAREFDSFPDFKGHIEDHPDWLRWLTGHGHLTILLDGLDEGLIRMATLVPRLKTFLETKPTDRLRLILTCRSFEWPESEGEQLASLWPKSETSEFVFELEPLRREDARLTAEQKGHDGGKFLGAVFKANVASLASRPITLFFLIDEFGGEDFHATSRSQLYKNGCRRLCEENNPERARLVRGLPIAETSTDEKIEAAGKLACGILLGGKHSIYFPILSQSSTQSSNVCYAKDLTNTGLLREHVVEHALGTGVFTALGGDSFGFTHQTFAECLAGQELAKLPLSQLRSLLCATDPASGAEYVIPQLVELAAWVAGDHAGFFAHLLDIDPPALLRSGVVLASPHQKAALVSQLLDLAAKNRFYDETGYWRFWRDLNHPGLANQLIDAFASPHQHLMVLRVAIDIAKACRLPELVPTFFRILRSDEGYQCSRSFVANALCACMPDDRLAEIEPLARGEVGPDPDQSILGHALQRLVPAHWTVSDALPFIKATRDSSHLGSYWHALDHLPKHLKDSDILPGLRQIRTWDGGFSSMSFRRKLCMTLVTRGLEKIDDPAICSEMVELWTLKSRDFREFFRTGDREDADFMRMNDEPRRKWSAAIINSANADEKERIDRLLFDTYRLLKNEDFLWVLENLSNASEAIAPAWANVVRRMIWNEQIRIVWWDEFIAAYRHSAALREEMPWFEETSIDTPARRSMKAHWLWHERRYERLRARQQRLHRIRDRRTEIDDAITSISAGESWRFIDLCWAISINDEGQSQGCHRHDITAYSGWETLSESQKQLARFTARQFLIERSDGWEEFHGPTNYTEPGVVAVWLLRDEIESDFALRTAVATKWIEAILGVWDTSSDHAKELFALAYRLNPSRAIHGLMREIWRDSERHGHPFAIRRAENCLDETLTKELIELIKTMRNPQTVRMAIYELREFDKTLAGELATYLLRRALSNRRFDEKMVRALIIAGLGTGARQIWIYFIPIFQSRPEFAARVLLASVDDGDSRNRNLCEELTEEEIGDLYLLLCHLFPPSEDPEEKSGFVTPRRGLVYFRSSVLEHLSNRSTFAACDQLLRLAAALPDQATWLLYRYQQTLSTIRRNEWQPSAINEIASVLANARCRLIRDNGDLMNLILESLDSLQLYLKETSLPAVEDLWHWEGAGQHRKNFRNKDEEAVSDYVARWLRDQIGPESRVVVNREVQPARGKRTDVIIEAWSQSHTGKIREETPLSVTIEVKGCWNGQIKNGAEVQLLNGYLRPFRRTHGIFLVAWFYSPTFEKIATKHTSELKFTNIRDARQKVADYAQPAKIPGHDIESFVLDCRLESIGSIP